MTWNILIALTVTVIIGAAVALLHPNNRTSDRIGAATFIATIIVIIYAGTITIREAVIRYEHSACTTYSQQTGRETRYVLYGYWDTDCLVNTSDGWITKNNIWSGDR